MKSDKFQLGEMLVPPLAGQVNSAYFESLGRTRAAGKRGGSGSGSEKHDQWTLEKMRWSIAFGGVVWGSENVGHVLDEEFCDPNRRRSGFSISP